MAIEPAVVNLPTIYQNAAYSVQLRLTDRLRPATIAIDGVIRCPCHGLGVSAKVVLLSQAPTASLCGAVLNQIYYVSPLDFTPETLRLSTAPAGGSVLNITGTEKQQFFLAQPVNITNYLIDADICRRQSNVRVQVATFTSTIDAAADGAFSLKLMPNATIGIDIGQYAYDVSMTPSNGERFYALRGEVPVAITRSRE